MLKKLYFILSFILLLQFATKAQIISNNENTTQLKFIKTFPNPATTEVTLAFQKGNSRFYSIQILNSIGKKMYQAKSLPSSFTIDLRTEKFYRGIYIYQLLDKTGVVIESGKILVVN